ncbi:alpha/beta-hydrolase, partial [Hymenopellis radicata]
MSHSATRISSVTVDDGIQVFYREAGKQDAPVALLLHGFPSSSFQYRDLITKLAPHYHVIAPDLPGFGFTVVPDSRNYTYTFANIAKTIEEFTYKLELNKFSVYVFDYGAPTGLRLALARPDAVAAIISQNGNAFVEGLGSFWDPIKAYWADPTSEEKREALASLLTYDSTKFQYVTGEAHPERMPPETWTLDYALLSQPPQKDIQLDLFLDYRTNVDLYPAFQAYFRTSQPPVLAIWGKNDPIFIPPGAMTFQASGLLSDVEVKFVDGGHFALENHVEEIGDAIISFL